MYLLQYNTPYDRNNIAAIGGKTTRRNVETWRSLFDAQATQLVHMSVKIRIFGVSLE